MVGRSRRQFAGPVRTGRPRNAVRGDRLRDRRRPANSEDFPLEDLGKVHCAGVRPAPGRVGARPDALGGPA